MDYKFLDKVVDQIVNETRINYEYMGGRIFLPSPRPPVPSITFFSLFFSPSTPFPSFSRHCEDVYGLNEDEIEYVWNEYKKIIKDKIKNNGL
jgi:hypothetical protein